SLKFVLIPAGEYLMGGEETAAQVAAAFDEKPASFQGEHPRHRVKFTRPYYMTTCEITEKQFQEFIRDSGHTPDVDRFGRQGDTFNPNEQRYTPERREFQGGGGRPATKPEEQDHPAVWVSWRDAQEFCRWLGRKQGCKCRLPTEAEWEFACRA